jgi:hypothetical protein
MASQYKRSRLWVDPAFQLRLMLRIGGYFLLYILLVWHFGFFLDVMRGAAVGGVNKPMTELYVDYFAKQQPLLIAMVLLVPAFLYNLLRFSHRVAGPLFRCRALMREMAAGKVVPEFHPRQHDLMRDLFEAFNALIRRCNAQAAPAANGHAPAADADAPAESDVGAPV